MFALACVAVVSSMLTVAAPMRVSPDRLHYAEVSSFGSITPTLKPGERGADQHHPFDAPSEAVGAMVAASGTATYHVVFVPSAFFDGVYAVTPPAGVCAGLAVTLPPVSPDGVG